MPSANVMKAVNVSEKPIGYLCRFRTLRSLSKKFSIMAKGQVRSNREVRKPKTEKSAAADKSASKTGGCFTTQIKDTEKQKK